MNKFFTWCSTLAIYLCGIFTNESLWYAGVAGLIAGMIIFNDK